MIKALIVLWVGGMLVGSIIGHHLGVGMMQTEAVDKGHAEYNSRSGEWQWKEEPR
jgi:hypothetical protein